LSSQKDSRRNKVVIALDEKKLAELLRSIIKEELQPIYDRTDELKQIVHALRDGQEELKAQMDSLSLDVHKLHGEVTAIKLIW
jgi:phage shock protein A